MLTQIFKSLAELIMTVIKWPLIIGSIFMAIMFILFTIWLLYFRFVKKMKMPIGEHYKVKKKNLFIKLFYLAPRQAALDRMNRNPEFFRYQGLIIYTGNQGSGKTSTMVHDILQMQEEYPNAKVMTNFGYVHEDREMKHWKQLLDFNNGIQGVIVGIDEIQNWFNSKQSKDFPPEMIQTVTTNRKNRRCMMGTAQRFYMVAKDIRTQCSEVRHCHTFGGVFTIVVRKTPIVDSDGNVDKEKFKGMYCWVHDPIVRESYDTYKMIEVLSKTGFNPANEQYRLNSPKDDIVISIDDKKKK